MRIPFSFVAAGILLLATTVGVATAIADRPDDEQLLVGAWDATIIPGGHTDDPADDLYAPFLNMLTVHADGTLVNTDTVVAAGAGLWRHVEGRTFRLRVVHLAMYDPEFRRSLDAFGFTEDGTSHVDVTVEVTLSADGRSATGTYVTEFRNDQREIATFAEHAALPLPAGAPAVATGAVEWTRIELRDDVLVP